MKSNRISNYLTGIVTLLLSCWASNIFAQESYDSSIDSISYQQYLQEDWETLYKTVRSAEKEGYGFYYLYLRAAFAAYYTERYTLALSYFRKAEQLYEINDIAKQIQYLSSLKSNNGITAARLYKKLPEFTKVYYKDPKTKIVSAIGFNSGYNFNANYKENSTNNISGTADIYGEEWLLKESIFNNISLSHHILPQLDIHHAYTNVIVNRSQRFDYLEDETSYDIQTIQHQYFFNPVVHINDNWSISPAFTGIWINSDFYTAVYDSTNNDYTINPESLSSDQYVISLNASYKNAWFWLEAASNCLLTEDICRWQAGINGLFYPLRNKKIYLGGGIHYLQNPNKEDNIIGNVKLGGNIENLNMSASYTFGNMKNYTEANGLIVYNSLEQMQSKLGAQLSYPVFKKQLYLSLYYDYLIYAANYFYFEEDLSTQIESFNINNHAISIGINYYF